MLVYAVVFYAAPNLEVRRWQWITPGAVFGVVTWIVASALFFLYVSNFSSYSATYGAFAARGDPARLALAHQRGAAVRRRAQRRDRRAPLARLPSGYDGPTLPAKEPADA